MIFVNNKKINDCYIEVTKFTGKKFMDKSRVTDLIKLLKSKTIATKVYAHSVVTEHLLTDVNKNISVLETSVYRDTSVEIRIYKDDSEIQVIGMSLSFVKSNKIHWRINEIS